MRYLIVSHEISHLDHIDRMRSLMGSHMRHIAMLGHCEIAKAVSSELGEEKHRCFDVAVVAIARQGHAGPQKRVSH